MLAVRTVAALLVLRVGWNEHVAVSATIVPHCFNDESEQHVCGQNISAPNVSVPSTFDAEQMFENCLAEDYDEIDPGVLPRSVTVLKRRGAHHSWHKHSTFLQHLVGVHNILHLWGHGLAIGRVGLFHSAYSNSYVNLALFDPNVESERKLVQDLIGSKAEDLVHMFCIIDRQEVVINTLLKNGFIPKGGLTVPHIRNASEHIYLSPETLRMLLVFTMADTADQYFGWQDQMFGGGGYKGSMIIPGQDNEENHRSTSVWPGLSRPGLWMSYLSELGRVARTFRPEWRRQGEEDLDSRSDEPVLNFPPVFDNCTKVLSVEDEAEAIDLYWSVMSKESHPESDEDLRRETENDIAALNSCIAKNPWIFEPHVLLAQKHLHLNHFTQAEQALQRALKIQVQWGTPWDKRLSFGAWVAWTRVLLLRAKEHKPWPRNAWEVNNQGLVQITDI